MEDKDKIWSNKGLIDQYGSTSGRNISNVNYCFFLHLGKETYNINGKTFSVSSDFPFLGGRGFKLCFIYHC